MKSDPPTNKTFNSSSFCCIAYYQKFELGTNAKFSFSSQLIVLLLNLTLYLIIKLVEGMYGSHLPSARPRDMQNRAIQIRMVCLRGYNQAMPANADVWHHCNVAVSTPQQMSCKCDKPSASLGLIKGPPPPIPGDAWRFTELSYTWDAITRNRGIRQVVGNY